MDLIYGSDIQKALETAYRVYLCGDLRLPQNLRWIYDEKNELGMSYYKEFTADQPHYHTTATEYSYVIRGTNKVLLIDEGREYLFETGSFFVLPPMTKYASKHLGGTKILFFKSPGGNDKQTINIDNTLENWLSSW